MEELLERQEKELEKLADKRDSDMENLAAGLAQEEDTLTRVFNQRRHRLQRRWELTIEILLRELEEKKGVRFAPIPLPEWPEEDEGQDETLAAILGCSADLTRQI